MLLHGLGRSSRSMRPVERALRRRGYQVLNLGYPSSHSDIDALAADVAQRIRSWEPSAPLDFVTHSLGGIIVRAAVAGGYLSSDRIRRVVMLGPPNGGSELADTLPNLPVIGPLYRALTGPAGMQLGAGADGIAARLPAVPFEVGVIAGDRSLNPIFSAMLGGPNDGKVQVEKTRVEGMRDFIVVRRAHPLLMAAPSVVAQAIHFLETGAFRRPRSSTDTP